MNYDFVFPDVGEGIQEGTIVKWNVKEGDSVKADQALGEVETDKAVVEIPSPKAGKIVKLHVAEGGVIKVGAVMVTFELAGEEKEKHEKVEAAKKPEEKKDAGTVIGFIEDEDKSKKPAEKIHIPRKEGSAPLVKSTHDAHEARAAHASAQPPETPTAKPAFKHVRKYDMFGYVDRIPLKGIRKAIADHMVQSASTAPQVTHFHSADVTTLVEIRNREKENAAKQGAKLTYMPFIIKALIYALEKHPMLRSTIEGEEIIVKKYYNFGIAVDTEAGLMVPVLKGANQKSMIDIAKEIMELAKKAKDRKLDMMDFKGGIFTITNLGVLGTEFFTPLINYPESAILGTGAIQEKPTVKDGQIVIRKVMPLSLSYDHRAIDGAEAARFMQDFVSHLEDPDLLLVEK